MAYIPFVFSKDTVTFVVNGQPYSVDKSFPSYPEVLKELKRHQTGEATSTDRLIELTQPVKAVQAAVERAEERAVESADYLPRGVVSVTSNEIRYNGEVVHGVLVDRILSLLADGFDIMPMVRFLENLYQNPADFARDELYLWLEGNNLPITEDGHFLAYKRVNSNFTSVHDGRTDNTPGKVVSVPREKVDPVRAHTCSTGLHFCSKEYLPHFSGNTIVILKINPADVVSIPHDYNNAKGRAWKYTVLSVFGEDPQSKVWPSVVGPTGEQIPTANDVDPDSLPLQFPSDLSKALFAALGEIDLSGDHKREDRLNWAEDVLDGENRYKSIDSFSDLTVGDAKVLLNHARALKAELDNLAATQAERELIAATQALDSARQGKIAAIHSFGIERLRREASQAGWTAAKGTSAYKGPRKDELIAFLVSQVK